MTIVFSEIPYKTCLANLDDIIFFAKSFENMLKHLDQALNHLKRANLKLKLSKCSFEKRSVLILSHIVSKICIIKNLERLRRIKKWPGLNNRNEARSFLRYASHYQKFTEVISHIVKQLKRIREKENAFN